MIYSVYKYEFINWFYFFHYPHSEHTQFGNVAGKPSSVANDCAENNNTRFYCGWAYSDFNNPDFRNPDLPDYPTQFRCSVIDSFVRLKLNSLAFPNISLNPTIPLQCESVNHYEKLIQIRIRISVYSNSLFLFS